MSRHRSRLIATRQVRTPLRRNSLARASAPHVISPQRLPSAGWQYVWSSGGRFQQPTLCEANGQQRGTIHQFFPGNGLRGVLKMGTSYYYWRSQGYVFPTRESLDKLAALNGLTITWSKT